MRYCLDASFLVLIICFQYDFGYGKPYLVWIFGWINCCIYLNLAGNFWNLQVIQPFMTRYAVPTSSSIVMLLLEIVSSASAIDSLMPTPISLESLFVKSSRSDGASDLPLPVRNLYLVSPDAWIARTLTVPIFFKTLTSASERTPSTSTTLDLEFWIPSFMSSATAPGPFFSRSSIIIFPRFTPVGSMFLLVASARTASPIVILSNPFDFRPSAIVVFPAPGIPVRHMISFTLTNFIL